MLEERTGYALRAVTGLGSWSAVIPDAKQFAAELIAFSRSRPLPDRPRKAPWNARSIGHGPWRQHATPHGTKRSKAPPEKPTLAVLPAIRSSCYWRRTCSSCVAAPCPAGRSAVREVPQHPRGRLEPAAANATVHRAASESAAMGGTTRGATRGARLLLRRGHANPGPGCYRNDVALVDRRLPDADKKRWVAMHEIVAHHLNKANQKPGPNSSTRSAAPAGDLQRSAGEYAAQRQNATAALRRPTWPRRKDSAQTPRCSVRSSSRRCAAQACSPNALAKRPTLLQRLIDAVVQFLNRFPGRVSRSRSTAISRAPRACSPRTAAKPSTRAARSKRPSRFARPSTARPASDSTSPASRASLRRGSPEQPPPPRVRRRLAGRR